MHLYSIIPSLALIAALTACTGTEPSTEHAQTETPSNRDYEPIAEFPLGPFEDPEGNLWLGSVGSGLFCYNGEEFLEYHSKDGLVGDRISSLKMGPDGYLWLVSSVAEDASISAVMRRTEKGFETLGFENWVGGIFINESQGIWTTSQNGIHQYDGTSFQDFPLPETPQLDPVQGGYTPHGIKQDAEGNFWFSTADRGAFWWDGENFRQFTTEDGLLTNNVSVEYIDRQGRVWISCFHWHLPPEEQNGGVCMWDGEKMHTFPDIQGLHHTEVYTTYEDKAGNIWFGATRHGVYRYDGQTFTFLNRAAEGSPQPSFGLNSMLEDSKGRFWFCFAGGLYRLEGEEFVIVGRNGPWD